MKFYAYRGSAPLGREPLGSEGKLLFELATPAGAIRRARNAFGDNFRLYSYTNFYNPSTFREVRASRDARAWSRGARDPRRRSRTREEWVASLRWNINDAKEALKNAVDLGDWRAVEKYTRQIREMEPKLYRAESGQLGVRRAGRQRMIGEEQHRRQVARYQERVREVEKRLRGQGFTGSVKDYAETLIATRGYDQQLLASIPRMRPRRIRPGEDD